MLLAFTACKKRDFLEPPQPNLSRFTATDPQTIALAQNWFKHQKEAFALRTEQKSTQREQIVDSLPWLPQWDLAKSYSLGNGKTLVLMPIWRYKNVIYNSDYGFMRRLKLIVSAQNRIEYGAITEVIALSKHDLPSQGDDIIYQSCMRNLPQGYFVYDIALDNPLFTRRAEERPESEGVCMELGQSDAGDMCVTYLLCTTNYIDFFFHLSISPIPCPRSTEDPQSGGNGSGNGFPPPNVPTPPINNVPMPGIGGGEPSTGGGGGGNIGGIYVGGTLPSDLGEPRTPIYSTPPSSNSPLIDYGDNTNPNQPYEPSALLKSFTQKKSDGSYDFGTLTLAEIKKLDETLQAAAAKSNIAKLVMEELKTHKIAWRKASQINATGTYSTDNRSITIQEDPDGEMFFFGKLGMILEEMMHALQHKKYGTNFTSIPRSNVEFEVKLIKEMIIRNIFTSDGKQFDWLNKYNFTPFTIFPKAQGSERFGDYIKNITNDGTYLPKNLNELTTTTPNETYWTMLEYFRSRWEEEYGANHPYAQPKSSQNPDVLLFLTSQCNCTQRLN